MAFKAKDRQRIIDGYLAESGRNMFIPSEFIDWLSGRPDHEAYDLFYGMTDDEAARQHRIALARRMASGLRIVVRDNASQSTVVSVTTREYPAFVSPVAGRRSGGGYEHTDPKNPAHIAELQRQGALALRGWLSRYRGVFEAEGFDLSEIEKIASTADQGDALSA